MNSIWWLFLFCVLLFHLTDLEQYSKWFLWPTWKGFLKKILLPCIPQLGIDLKILIDLKISIKKKARKVQPLKYKFFIIHIKILKLGYGIRFYFSAYGYQHISWIKQAKPLYTLLSNLPLQRIKSHLHFVFLCSFY